MSIAFWQVVIVIIILVVALSKLIKRSNQKELEEWNKNNKRKFEEYRDLKWYLHEKKINEKEDERLKEKKEDERIKGKKEDERIKGKKDKEQIVKPKKESFTKTMFSRGGSLTANIARLKKLYKNGTLTKAEFEKAKNNLLK